MPEQAQSDPQQRRAYISRGIIFLAVAILLLLLALLLFGFGAPEWNADGSRDAYSDFVRALLCATLVSGTLLLPISARAFVLAALPSKALAVVLGIFVGVAGLIVVPIELWLALGITDAEEAGARERYENAEDWDWD